MLAGAAMEPTSAADNDKPHAVFFPFPAQGHVKPAFLLAKLLYHRGFHVTFVHSEHNRRRLLRSRGAAALAGVPGFRFAAVPDGLPPSDEDASQDMAALLSSLEAIVPHFNNLLSELNDGASCGAPLVTCVVSDISSILRATKEMGVPAVALWTASSCAFMGFLQYQRLIDKGIIPLKDAGQLSNGHLDSTVIDWLPGMPKDMRLRDLLSFIRATDREDPVLLICLRLMECLRTTPSAIILHTFDELDRELINAMPSAILPRIYAVGPLPLLAGHISGGQTIDKLGSNLSEENHACLQWLHGKEPSSVVYVNFGSLVLLTNEQLVEFAWGLANSGYDFLWVIRNDQAKGSAPSLVLPREFLEETKKRGHVTSWCPQEAVLQHEAIGAFLTHCGWNSVLESLCAGVPMLCWPFAGDQQTNCRYACTEWRIGMEIGGDVERDEVEAVIREVMEGDTGKEMKRMAVEWKEKATVAARPGGPSWVNLERVVSEVLAVPLAEKC